MRVTVAGVGEGAGVGGGAGAAAAACVGATAGAATAAVGAAAGTDVGAAGAGAVQALANTAAVIAGPSSLRAVHCMIDIPPCDPRRILRQLAAHDVGDAAAGARGAAQDAVGFAGYGGYLAVTPGGVQGYFVAASRELVENFGGNA